MFSTRDIARCVGRARRRDSVLRLAGEAAAARALVFCHARAELAGGVLARVAYALARAGLGLLSHLALRGGRASEQDERGGEGRDRTEERTSVHASTLAAVDLRTERRRGAERAPRMSARAYADRHTPRHGRHGVRVRGPPSVRLDWAPLPGNSGKSTHCSNWSGSCFCADHGLSLDAEGVALGGGGLGGSRARVRRERAALNVRHAGFCSCSGSFSRPRQRAAATRAPSRMARLASSSLASFAPPMTCVFPGREARSFTDSWPAQRITWSTSSTRSCPSTRM